MGRGQGTRAMAGLDEVGRTDVLEIVSTPYRTGDCTVYLGDAVSYASR